jgi:hypothetical protein
VYEVMNHILTRSQALQPQVKRLFYFRKTIKKYLVIKKLFSPYLIGDFISPTLDVFLEVTLLASSLPITFVDAGSPKMTRTSKAVAGKGGDAFRIDTTMMLNFRILMQQQGGGEIVHGLILLLLDQKL